MSCHLESCCGPTATLQLGSILMFMTQILTKVHRDARLLFCHLSLCWDPRTFNFWGSFQTELPVLTYIAMKLFEPEMMSKTISESMASLQIGSEKILWLRLPMKTVQISSSWVNTWGCVDLGDLYCHLGQYWHPGPCWRPYPNCSGEGVHLVLWPQHIHGLCWGMWLLLPLLDVWLLRISTNI